MKAQDIVGDYTIIGSNQDFSEDTYKGKLFLTLANEHRINAKWLINNDQEQFGTGFFKDNILVINFYYQGINAKVFNGTVVYKCLTKDILEGFWNEEEGNPHYLGTENCFRIKNTLVN